jgi:hypothetical protein
VTCGRPFEKTGGHLPPAKSALSIRIEYPGEGFYNLAVAKGFDEEIFGPGPDCFHYYLLLADGTDHDHPGGRIQNFNDL